MASKEYHWATRPYGYAGEELDRGQIFELGGHRNDEKLLRLGYAEPYNGKVNEMVECPECGARFVGHRERSGHVKRRHREVLSPEDEDRLEDSQHKIADELNPLKLENAAGAQA